MTDDCVPEWEQCESCDGVGGPPSHWDDETCRWQHYVCSSCGGNGGRIVWG